MKDFFDYEYISMEDINKGKELEITKHYALTVNYNQNDVSQILNRHRNINKLLIDNLNNNEIADLKIDVESCDTLYDLSIRGVSSLSLSSFSDCCNLRNVQINSRVISLPESIFANCISLESISLPIGLQVIGTSAFYNCKSLENIEIPDTIYKIYSGAFKFCVSLKDIYLSSKVNIIHETAFSFCKNLNIHIDSDNKTYYTYDNMIIQKSYPNTVISCHRSSNELLRTPMSSKAIGFKAFEGNTDVKEIIIEGDLESISSYAFAGCSSLEKIKFPDSITSIGIGAFENCIKLKDLQLPKGLKKIEIGTFYHCDSLIALDIPDNIEEIEGEAFKSCDKLKAVLLPKSLKKLEFDSFYNCRNLSVVYLNSILEDFSISSFERCPLETIFFHGSKEQFLKSITHFRSNINDFKNIEIQYSVPIRHHIIGLRHGENWDKDKVSYKNKNYIVLSDFSKDLILKLNKCSAVKDLIIYKNLDNKNEISIHKSKYLENLIIPESVQYIKSLDISDNEHLRVILNNNKNSFKIANKKLILSNNGKDLYQCISNDIKEIIVPKGVYSISTNAFKYCEKLNVLRLPKEIKEIDSNAFNEKSIISTIIFNGTIKDWLDVYIFKPNLPIKDTKVFCIDGIIEN